MKKRTGSSCVIWISFSIVIFLLAVLVYNQLTAVYEGVCYNKGATVIDPAQCCAGGVLIPDTVGNSNVYTPLYLCNDAPDSNVNTEYDRVNNCFKTGAIRRTNTDCCNGFNVITNMDASGNQLPSTYSCN